MSSGKPSARLGDQDTGHGQYPPTPIISGAGSVTIGGKPAARVGDSLAPHHPGPRVITAGSSSVTIEGKPATRIGDPINCGGVIASGEGSVRIGDAAPALSAGPLSAAFEEYVTVMLDPATTARSPHQLQALQDSIAVKYEPRFTGDTVGQLKPEYKKPKNAAVSPSTSTKALSATGTAVAHNPTELSAPEPTDKLDISALDSNAQPAAGLVYKVILADDSDRTGQLDVQGKAQETGLPPGQVKVSIGGPASSAEIRQQRAALRDTLETLLRTSESEARQLSQALAEKPNLASSDKYQKTGLRGLWNGAVGLMSTAENLSPINSCEHAFSQAWQKWAYTDDAPFVQAFRNHFPQKECDALIKALGITTNSITPEDLAHIGPKVYFLWHDTQTQNGFKEFSKKFRDTQEQLNLANTAAPSQEAVISDLVFSALLLNAGATLEIPASQSWVRDLTELGGILSALASNLRDAELRLHQTGQTNANVEFKLKKPNYFKLKPPTLAAAKHRASLAVHYPNGNPFPLPAVPTAVVNGSVCTIDETDETQALARKQHLLATDDVCFELWEETLEQKQASLRASIKKTLDELLAQTQAEAAREDALFFQDNIGSQAALVGGSFLVGIGDGFMGLVEFVVDVVKTADDIKRLTARTVINAMEAGWAKLVEGDEVDFYESFSEKHVEDFAQLYGVTPAQIQQSLLNAYEIFNYVKDDKALWEILFSFAKSYALAHSITDYAEFAGAFLFDLILAIVLAVTTGGVGNVAHATAKIRHVKKLMVLGDLFQDFVRLSKLKLTPRRVPAVLDDVAKVTVRPPKHPPPQSLSTRNLPEPGSQSSPDTLGPGIAKNTQTDAPGTNRNGDPDQPINCTPTSGCPISLITGEEILSHVDFTFPGPLGQVWRRTYRSSNRFNQRMGHGWNHGFSDTLIVKGNRVALCDSDARLIKFNLPAVGHQCINRSEKLRLFRRNDTDFEITSIGPGVKTTRHFKPLIHATRLSLAQLTDPFGNHIDFHYSHDKLIRIDTLGHYWQLHYNNEHLTTVRWHTPSGEDQTIVRYEYNEDNDLIRAEDALGNSERYAYRHHLLMRRTLKSGYRFHFEWDEQNQNARCLRNWGDDIDGQATYNYRFLWDKAHHKVTVTDTRGGQTTTQFNAKGQQIYSRLPEGGETHQTFDLNGNLIKTEDALGGIDHFSYNQQDQLLETIGKMGEKTQLTRDDTGNITGIVDPMGNRWQRRFNLTGQLIEQANPLGEKVRYRYNSMGLLNSLIDAQGQHWHYIWDNEARLLAIKNPLGQQTRYTYNAFGDLTKITWPDGQVKTYTYNALRQCTEITHADGKKEKFEYSPLGLVTTYQDSAGRKTQYVYNGLSQVVRRIDPAGQQLEYHYDGERNLVGLTNEKGERYTLRYDLDERLIEEVGFDQRIQSYEYNALGQLTSSSDFSRQDHRLINNIAFKRDAHGRLLQQIDSLNNNILSEYRYDSNGRITAAKNTHRTLQWRYDALGRVVEDWQDDHVLRHHYEGVKRAHSFLPEGAQLTYHYSPMGDFQALELDGVRINEIERDGMGRELKRSLCNDIITDFNYDPQGRLIAQRSQKFSNENPIQTISQRQYHYNNAGQLAQIDDHLQGSIHYHYDVLDRLTRVQGPCPEKFIHDPAGNLLDTSANTHAQPAQGNRLHFHGDAHYDYDERGNRTLKARGQNQRLVTHYEYDALNQLTTVIEPDEKIEYAYDALGRRISKTTATSRTDFLWYEDVLLNEMTSSLDGEQLGQLRTYLYEPGTFKPLAFVENDEIYHYHLDHLGTPQEITNNEGEVVWAMRFKAYGNLAVAHTQAVENNLRFQGQYYDHETGLHYNRFRYYDPSCGRFVNQDPIKLLGGNNNYKYVTNPISWIDPLGLTGKEPNCPKGTADVYHYQGPESPHFAVVTEHAGKKIGTEQWGGTGTKTLDIEFDPNEPQDMALVGVYNVELPDARSAQQHQNSLVRQGEHALAQADYDPEKLTTPDYCAENQSCLTHVFDVLNAGGKSAPKTSPANMGTARYIRGLQRESNLLKGGN